MSRPELSTAFSHILVDVDALAAKHPALDQAVDLAVQCRARVTIVDILPEVPRSARDYVSERMEQELVDHRRQGLQRATARYRRRKVEIATEILRGHPASALVEFALRQGADLVVRSRGRELAAGRAGFGAVEMQLLRKCSAPVWIVGARVRTRPKRILAAIHPDKDDPVEQRLNYRIIDAARTMSALFGASLTILTAWAPYGEGLLGDFMSAGELKGFVGAARARAQEALDELVGTVPLGRRCRIELIKGEAEVVIPRYTRRHRIDMVVMGTLARTGLVGLVMGNTAERMLQQLTCSVLALKPEGFKSPIRP